VANARLWEPTFVDDLAGREPRDRCLVSQALVLGPQRSIDRHRRGDVGSIELVVLADGLERVVEVVAKELGWKIGEAVLRESRSRSKAADVAWLFSSRWSRSRSNSSRIWSGV